MRKVASTSEMLLVFAGFLASMVHWGLCAVFFAALLLLLTQQGTIGCIKGLLIVTTRGILSTAVSSGMTSLVQMEKWAVIFLFSFYILFSLNKRNELRTITRLRGYVLAFSVYVIAASFLTSSYPVVSAFKVIAYAIPFCAVASGVAATNSRIDWIGYLHLLLTPVIVLCMVLIPMDSYRIVNASFQGAINHPNLMGIFGAIYVAITLYVLQSYRGRLRVLWLVLLAATFYMIYLSESRTGMFSAVLLLVVHLVSQQGRRKTQSILLLVVVVIVGGLYFSGHKEVYYDTVEEINRFIYKRDTDDILDSRQGQVDASGEKYDAHPLLGSGFAVPYQKGVVDRKFSLDLTYEAGNLPLSVLGDTGILGSILFWWYMLYVFAYTQRSKWVLFFLPIVVSFGEMAFFATNNVAIYYYFLYGVCLAREKGA